MRTLAVCIIHDLRARLDIIAQLTERTVTEEIRLALEHWIERSKSDPDVLANAETVRADIAKRPKSRTTPSMRSSQPSRSRKSQLPIGRPTRAMCRRTDRCSNPVWSCAQARDQTAHH
jgi:hypothetical protein